MVSPFTLGLFAPLPLAMMIPFMATQSLAMGEAFGKSFQYGKRKISSMSNEEFNKLTFNDLMDQQTANIKSIIPKLHEQMTDSKQMQEDIFREMTKLVPAFINGLGLGIKDEFGSIDKTPFNKTIPDPNNPQIYPASHETSQANVQEVTIINASHGGKSTIETPTKNFTQSTGQDDRIQFRNKISNWNRNTVTEAFKAGSSLYQPWQLQLLQEQLDKINKFENPIIKTPIINQTKLTTQQTKQKEYLKKTVDLQKEIIALYPYTLNPPQNQGHINKLKKWRTMLKNLITRSRNDIMLKSVANRDWNDRIWLIK